MSEPETFLTRWSRRKHAAAAEPVESREAPACAAYEEPAEGTAASRANDVTSAARGADAVAPLFDLASLPPIESIAADTDIRAFLAPGVPPELARAALRRAWAADPKIRDFVGLADYDWDFNASGSMAGFGPLEMTKELREIAARIIGPPPVAEPAAGPAERSDLLGQEGSPGEIEIPPDDLIHDKSDQQADADDPSSERNPSVAAVQSQPDAAEKSQLVVRPRHGGALPK